MKVKICGITNWADAKRAVDAGADMLGFNFYPPSPRYISPSKAKGIVRRLPKRIAKVGVFVNESEQQILAIADDVGLDRLQLHGDESPLTVAHLGRKFPVIKALRAGKAFRSGRVSRYRRSSAILLDGFDKKLRGGTGKTLDWRMARRANRYARIFLAGGLTPDNIADAIRTAQPYAIDVCSGVESKPGKKDPKKLRQLMTAVETAQKRRSQQ